MRKSLAVFTPIALATAALMPSAAIAQQQINVFFPFENATCATWVKFAGNRAIRQQYEFWVLGFVSGYNYATPARQVPTGKLPVGNQLYVYLDEYCHDNPNSSVIGGAFRLTEQFREATPPSKPQPAPAKKDAAKAPAPAPVR